MSEEKPFPAEDSSWSNIALERKAEADAAAKAASAPPPDPAIAAAEKKAADDKAAADAQAAADAAELAQLRADKAKRDAGVTP